MLTHLPFKGLPGNIYRSRMPFRWDDPTGQVLLEMKQKEVYLVVMLASDEEALYYIHRDLRKLYQDEGFQVIYFPFTDGGVPDRAAFDEKVDEVIDLARQGKNTVVHCVGGKGRTGLFLVEMAKKVMKIPGREALEWVRSYVPEAVETGGQERFIG